MIRESLLVTSWNVYQRSEVGPTWRRESWLYICYYVPFFLLPGCPSVVRADRGTENANVARMQRFFRRNGDDCFFGEKSFMYGRSTANQVFGLNWNVSKAISSTFVPRRELRRGGHGWGVAVQLGGLISLRLDRICRCASTHTIVLRCILF